MATIGLSGGKALEAKLRQIAERATTSAELRAGFLENATYPDGQYVATIAAINEFGAPAAGIPPRPFFRGMIAKESPHWADDIGKLLTASDYDSSHALGLMGMEIKNELQDAIKAFDDPSNAPSTIAKKGFDQPLIDTGVMWQSVDFEVVSKTGSDSSASPTSSGGGSSGGGFLSRILKPLKWIKNLVTGR